MNQRASILLVLLVQIVGLFASPAPKGDDIKVYNYNGYVSCGNVQCPASTATCLEEKKTDASAENIITISYCYNSNGDVLEHKQFSSANPNPGSRISTKNSSSAGGYIASCSGPNCATGTIPPPPQYSGPSASEIQQQATDQINKIKQSMHLPKPFAFNSPFFPF